MPIEMASIVENPREIANMIDQVSSSWNGHAVWVSMESSPEEVAELTQCFLKVVEFPEKEVRVETEGWMAKGLVARSFDWRVSAKVLACEFWQWAKLKGEVATFNLE